MMGLKFLPLIVKKASREGLLGQVDYLIKLLQAKKGLGFRAFKTKRLFRGVEGPLSKTLNPKP